MASEGEANDHVPLAFLLGARAKNYFRQPGTSNSRQSTDKPKGVFSPSIHPRKREEKARRVLRRVLEQAAPRDIDTSPQLDAVSTPTRAKSSRAAVLKALAESNTPNQSDPFQPSHEVDYFQLTLEVDPTREQRSPGRNQGPHRLVDSALELQEQRGASFHGYQQDGRAFLDVTGAAAHIPRTTTRQLRELKLRVMKAKQPLEDQRTQKMLAFLQEQQSLTRIALRHQQQLLETETVSASSASKQGKRPPVVPTREFTLANALDGSKSSSTDDETINGDPTIYERPASGHSAKFPAVKPLVIPIPTVKTSTSAALADAIAATEMREERERELQSLRERIHQQRTVAHEARQQGQEVNRQQKRLMGRSNARRPSFLATLQLDPRSIPLSSPAGTTGTQTKATITIENSSMVPLEHSPDSKPGVAITQDAASEGQQVRSRLGARQRETFVSTAANGVFLGGGFIAKKGPKRRSKHTRSSHRIEHNTSAHTETTSAPESLEATLGTRIAPILPADQVNELALRRRASSAGWRRHRTQSEDASGGDEANQQ